MGKARLDVEEIGCAHEATGAIEDRAVAEETGQTRVLHRHLSQIGLTR
jgi:hypothetical protein